MKEPIARPTQAGNVAIYCARCGQFFANVSEHASAPCRNRRCKAYIRVNVEGARVLQEVDSA
jgi:predicted  nucleic acid-binding Zn-ribbon protein